MAVTGDPDEPTVPVPAGPARAVPAAPGAVPIQLFIRLKLRVMANSLRGQRWRIALHLVGVLLGLGFAGTGFLIFALPGLVGSGKGALLTAAFGGGLLVVGWLLLPLVFFGVDETLDPARFALLPLRRRTLLTGLLAAALVGTPAIAQLLATTGLVMTATALGGPVAGLTQLVGIAAGLLLCVATSRAVTSAFAGMLRSRRMRDLAAVLLAVLAALLGPLQLAVLNGLGGANWDRLAGVALVVGWTPLAAPYTVGVDVVEGRLWAVPVKLLITALTVGALLWWWARSLESAMVSTASGGPATVRASTPGRPVDQLFPRVLGGVSRDRYGALIAREVRYWWRDMRRRSNLITFFVVGVFVPVMVNVGGRGMVGGQSDVDVSATTVSLSMLLVGVLAAVTLANQFGFDGSAYAANVIAGVPGRLEMRARVLAFSFYVVPLLVAIAVGLGLFLREPGWIGVTAGTLLAAYGAGSAVNLVVSVLGAYALPETANPFAIGSAAGMARSLLAFVSMVVSAVAALPMVVAAALVGDVWLWLALPVGIGYAVGAAALGVHVAGDLLDRRMPEVLATVTPRR